eukprot:Pgem_evm1s11193
MFVDNESPILAATAISVMDDQSPEYDDMFHHEKESSFESFMGKIADCCSCFGLFKFGGDGIKRNEPDTWSSFDVSQTSGNTAKNAPPHNPILSTLAEELRPKQSSTIHM